MLAQSIQRFGEDHDRTRQVEKELEILRKNDIDFQDKITLAIKTIKEIKDNRDVLKKEWQISKISENGK